MVSDFLGRGEPIVREDHGPVPVRATLCGLVGSLLTVTAMLRPLGLTLRRLH